MVECNRCRVCQSEFRKQPVLSLSGLPGAAQNLPTQADLATDKPISLDIIVCEACGVVQILNPAVPYFREVIRASGYSEEMRVHRHEQFSRLIEKYDLEGKKILEVGCGRGENLEILDTLEISAIGVEFGPEAIQHVHASGLSAVQMFFETGDEVVPGGLFDSFIFLNFLEHLPHPRTIFRGIRNNLQEDAIGLVEVPNFDMILEKSLYTEFIADHLFYFSQASLENTLRSNGFEVLECGETWHRYTLTAVVKKRRGVVFFHMAELKAKLEVRLKKFFDEHPKDGVAIWGAGHQALTVMAMAALKGRVRYVVDSAPFKQGRYTPGTHIPIVSPDTFFEDSLSAVLVIAGSYTNEVCETIKSGMNRKMTIAFLDSQDIIVVEN